MSGKYVPPNKRKKETGNLFKRNIAKPPTPPPAPEIENLASFPTFGESKTGEPEVSSSISYADYIKKMHKKKKPEIEPGWVKIYKENGVIKYKYGKKVRPNHVNLRNFFAECKRQRAIEDLEFHLDRQEFLNEIEDELSGGRSIESWQVNDYLKERRKEKHVELDSDSESDIPSDDDFDDEFTRNK